MQTIESVQAATRVSDGDYPRRARIVPADLSQGIESIDGSWLVLQTAFPLATQLDLRDRFGAWSYVPLRKVRKYSYGEPDGWTDELLFKGYAFVRATESQFEDCRRARFAWGAVPVPNQSQLTSELLAVQRMLAINPRVEVATGIIPGAKVKILDGPYRGQEGVIIRKDTRDLFAVMVSMLGGALMTDVSASRMEMV